MKQRYVIVHYDKALDGYPHQVTHWLRFKAPS